MSESIRIDGRRARGDASRQLVLSHAVDLASLEGLDQLSIGRIAGAANLSKSSVAALFGSKERLQLAAVENAAGRFEAAIVTPAREKAPGIRRLAALLDRLIAYSEDGVFPGGCFFSSSAADFHAKPGAVREAIWFQLERWLQYVAATARFAAEAEELSAVEDPDQLAFELQGVFEWMNLMAQMTDSNLPHERARRAYRDRLLSLGADPAIAEQLLEPGASLR